MTKILKLRILAIVFLLVSLPALTIPMALSANAQEVWPCVYTGRAYWSSDDSNPVLDGTGIQVLDGLTVIGNTTTGNGTWPWFDPNQFYVDGVIAVNGTVVNFQIWDAGNTSWVPAVETAIHEWYGRVEVDLHTGAPSPDTLHIDSHQAFLFIYPGPDCDLPEALTNIGPPNLEYPLAANCTIAIWGQEDIGGPDTGKEWISYDVETGGGFLGDYGLDAGQPYVLTHDDCYCIDWEMCE